MFNFYSDLLSGEEGMGIIFVNVDVDLAAASLSTRTEVLAAMTLWAGRITQIEPASHARMLLQRIEYTVNTLGGTHLRVSDNRVRSSELPSMARFDAS